MKKNLKYFFTLALLVISFVACSDDELSNEQTKLQGEKFLVANKAKEGVKVTSTGLQYKVLTEGDGTQPNAGSMVTVKYKGSFIDGKVFDSSAEPISFGLSQVIPGWTEGVQLMRVGAKYRFYIPYQLGYGARGNSRIPGYSALVFDVELLKFK